MQTNDRKSENQNPMFKPSEKISKVFCRKHRIRFRDVLSVNDIPSVDNEHTSFARRLLQSVRNDTPGRRRELFNRDRIERLPYIDIRHPRDYTSCHITDMYISKENKRLIIADSSNRAVKIINPKTLEIVRYVRFSISPKCLTEISGESKPLYCLVFDGERQLTIVDMIHRPARFIQTIPIAQDCKSVFFSKKCFILHCENTIREGIESHNIAIVNKQGEEVNVIDLQQVVVAVEGSRFRVQVHEQLGSIFVSCDQMIYKMNLLGQVLCQLSVHVSGFSDIPILPCVDQGDVFGIYMYSADILVFLCRCGIDLNRNTQEISTIVPPDAVIPLHFNFIRAVCCNETFYLLLAAQQGTHLERIPVHQIV